MVQLSNNRILHSVPAARACSPKDLFKEQQQPNSHHINYASEISRGASVMSLYHILVQSSLMRALLLLLLLLLLPIPVSSRAIQSPPSNTITMLSGSNNATDRLALLAFKSLIYDDPSRALASWNKESLHLFCRWQGVTCNEPGRITGLDLDSLNLAGSITPFFSNLIFLQRLNLSNNRLHGLIPREFGSLLHLQHLDLSFNSLAGEIPSALSHCSQLQSIDLSSNKLHGEIPNELGSLLSLKKLKFGNNSLTGGIPLSIGVLSSLRVLTMPNNYLTGGIPESLGNLSSLAGLDLSFNNLSGVIPPSLWNLSSLTDFYVQYNKLSGELPREIGHFLPRLQNLDMSYNEFSGTIPTSLGAVAGLTRLLLSHNQLEAREAGDWAFLNALTNCSNLRVLQLSHNRLRGAFPGAIANLTTRLEWLVMSGNEISGSIPPEISNLVNLTTLYLNYNLLTGTIPPTIGDLQRLQQLSLGNNMISGAIPPSIGNLSQLNALYLSFSQLTGGIPPSIRNISSLSILRLSDNELGGNIPPWLASLSGLTEIYLSFNHLIGDIPPPLWNLSYLRDLAVGGNKLTGELPSNIGQTLPHLRYLLLYENQFHGPIPSTLHNASALELIQLGGNAFGGTIPRGLGTLQSLSDLLLGRNKFEASDWSFLDALTNCTKLRRLDLAGNKLGGMLPNSIANLSERLEELVMRGNQISGSIPANMGNLISINLLDLGQNFLAGSIPSSIGRLSSLQVLNLDGNKFSGEIPFTIGNLTGLNQLNLNLNELSGSIPISLRNCQLESLSLDYNKLNGTIPKEILLVSSLSKYLGLSHNSLSGPLPREVGRLRNLGILDVSVNKLSGVIPSSLGECQILEYLYMDQNFFSGIIPSSLQELRGLQALDLSRNNLSGHIPKFLETLPFLTSLNLSFNNLEGEVPNAGVFRNLSTFSLLGNDQLCGGRPNFSLQQCSIQTSARKSWALILLAANAVLWCIVLYLYVACFVNQNSSRESLPMVATKDQSMELPHSWRDHMEVSYDVLSNATDGFSTTNLIGRGSFGSVYKGTMDGNGKIPIAVKVLDLQQRGASKSFIAECEALRNIRHRNLVKVFTSCSSLDSLGNEFKALVFEYMPNGSLEMWLHPRVTDRSDCRSSLTLIQRLNIVIDVASALDYLHHHCPIPIAHCDLKPGNILLDYEMNAHVGDFGLARFLAESVGGSLQNPTGSIGLRGSIGYVAPEYGMANRASTEGDVYSYGVLLLEIFTGKRPTDETFEDELGLCKYVEMAFPGGVMGIADPRLLTSEGEGGESNGSNQSIGDDCRRRTQECLVSVFRIGISCTKELPRERMRMGDVLKELVETKIALSWSQSKN